MKWNLNINSKVYSNMVRFQLRTWRGNTRVMQDVMSGTTSSLWTWMILCFQWTVHWRKAIKRSEVHYGTPFTTRLTKSDTPTRTNNIIHSDRSSSCHGCKTPIFSLHCCYCVVLFLVEHQTCDGTTT